MQVYYSPQFQPGNKNPSLFRTCSPNYKDNNNNNNILGFQKGWCSERVPLSRRDISGRTVPSKWDDAERWITSPVTQPQRSPVVDCFSSNMGGSPGVLVPNGLSFEMVESDSQDEKEDENGVSRVASRRDMATQMSPESSPEASLTHTPPPPVGPTSHHSARVDIRDVQVDKGTTMTKQSKRHKMEIKNTQSPKANDFALTWNNTQGAMKLSKLQKEEARITAWENLQNAKAEASVRKLEMKLEKKKSASLDKILNKHRAAQRKAEEMRRNISEDVSPKNSHKFRSLHRFITNSVKGCFHHHRS